MLHDLPFSDLAILFGALVLVGVFAGYVIGFSVHETSPCYPNRNDFAFVAAGRGGLWGAVGGIACGAILTTVAIAT